ncbi:MAG: radical SAM protein, partial [Candidatus Omnitrophica bacterium]|nr:radical SAM protein [Candidatus Omnitrophota bacterium]
MSLAQTNTKQPTPSLQSLYFYLTSYCNLNCLHCWIAPSYIDKEEAPSETPFELLKDIIDQAIPLGLKSIKITGGEPFLNKNIFPLISYASSKNLNITIETNGTLIDEEATKFLKENHIGMVAVSLDGPNREIHERLRAKQGCFEKTLKAIKFLKKYGLNVQVIMSIYKFNREYLEDTINFAEDLGVNSFKINCISNISRGQNLKIKGDTLEIKDYLEINHRINHGIQPRHKIRIILDIPPAFKTIKDIKKGGRCNLKYILGILADGSISICGIGEILSSLKLGDIRKEALE